MTEPNTAVSDLAQEIDAYLVEGWAGPRDKVLLTKAASELQRLTAEVALFRERDALTRKALKAEGDGPLQFVALQVRQERDRATAALVQQQALLSQAREVLERVGCQFDMCTGPTIAPVDMRTCFVCEFLGRTWADGVQR